MYKIDPKTGKQKFYAKDGSKSVISAIISILIGMLVGTVIIVIVGLTSPEITGKGILEGIKLVFLGVFSTGRDGGDLSFGFNPVNMGNLLFRATPLIMTGLSVAVAFKTGLFNIGAPGQYLMGTTATLYVALTIPTETVPAWIVWILAFLAGIIAGALWGSIPGILKAYLNINEVITCIMTNWIAANLVTWFFDVRDTLKNSAEGGKVGYIRPTASNGVETFDFGLDKLFPGSQVNGGIIIAIIIAVLMYIIMSKTTFGYQLKACGSNRHAAKYAGINDKLNIIYSMAIAGALSAAGASLYYLSGNTEFFWTTYQALPAEGFNGIPVALLASNHPVAVVFTGCFMSMLNIAGMQLKTLTAYNEYITDIIIASIVYLSAFAMIIKMFLNNRQKKKEASEEGGNK
ncbi:MAG: ABC transporter permease [Clostridiales bacterium]|nr:ABC transporter permease [Bacillota bacterium]MEE0516332.1 ABC transporter permease [Anaerovoracaceae bacterium]PWL94481.1 MAG: ABC transporter permease [Clostridiales bacterium]PWL95383.1 MAG: ABC transporter permease [Clostridiales bacterium]